MNIKKQFGAQSTDGDVQSTIARLVQTLNNSKTAVQNNPLYQTIFGLIKNVEKYQIDNNSRVTSIQNTISGGGGGGGDTPVIPGLTNLSYATIQNEQGTLPNSRSLAAGDNIAFADNGVTLEISATIASGYWTLLTDGDVDETDFIFADGDAISVFVPD